jgi:ribosome biogenesis protein MAK21
LKLTCELPISENPDDAKWLETALHKGTSKDRANAGALLVQTNPISNLSALESLIGLAKVSSKGAVDVLEIVTELFKNSLLPQ